MVSLYKERTSRALSIELIVRTVVSYKHVYVLEPLLRLIIRKGEVSEEVLHHKNGVHEEGLT